MSMLLLTTTGAKSGRTYLNPLAAFEEDGRLFVIASKAGAPRIRTGTTTWLPTRPSRWSTTATTFEATARVLPDDERDPLFARIVEQAHAVRRVPGEDEPEDPAGGARARQAESVSRVRLRRAARRRARPRRRIARRAVRPPGLRRRDRVSRRRRTPTPVRHRAARTPSRTTARSGLATPNSHELKITSNSSPMPRRARSEASRLVPFVSSPTRVRCRGFAHQLAGPRR